MARTSRVVDCGGEVRVAPLREVQKLLLTEIFVRGNNFCENGVAILFAAAYKYWK
jgi:hypothetical protein